MFKQENECFVSTQEMLSKKGYHTYVPKIGGIGRALMEASKKNPEDKWLKNQVDTFFRALRRDEKKEKKRKND